MSIRGGPQAMSTRWQAEGRIQGQGRTVIWFPSSGDDQISVAVRCTGGVAVIALRAGQVA